MSTNKLPALVDPEEWISRTSSALSARGARLEQVDRAYARWHAQTMDRQAQTTLLQALDAYLLANGGHWHKVSRNTASNGQMEYIHGLLQEALKGKPNLLQSHDIPHARYGVLYLLGHTRVETDAAKSGLQALAQVGGAVAAGLNGSARATPIPHTPFNARQAASLGQPAVGQLGANLAASPAAKRHDARNFIDLAEPQPAAAAHGLSYTRTTAAMIRQSPQMYGPAAAGMMTGALIGDAAVNAYQAIKSVVQQAVEAVVRQVQRLLVTDSLSLWTVSGALVRQAVVQVVEFIAGHAVPFLKSGMDLGHNLVKSIEHIYQNGVVLRLRCKHFHINPGHPASIANAIQLSMLADLGKSLLSAGLSAGKLFLEAVTGGAAVLATALASALEWLVSWLMAQHEKSQLEQFLDEARGVLAAERRLGSHDAATGQFKPNMVAARGGLINDLKAFTAFFDRGCKASVTVPMLTLNSGICGNAMTYTKMFKSDASTAEAIDQQTFHNSTEYFSQLKAIGARYLRNKGFSFSSDKPDVRGYLMHAVRDHQQVEGKVAKALAFL